MSETLTEAQLAEWERLEREATPGPWWIDWETTKETMVDAEPCNVAAVYSGMPTAKPRPDAAFIVAARTALPLLLAEVRRLRGSGDARLREAAPADDDDAAEVARLRVKLETAAFGLRSAAAYLRYLNAFTFAEQVEIDERSARAPLSSPSPETRATDCGCDGYCVCGDGGER